MRVVFIVQHPIEGPTSRFRVYQFLPYLQAQGIELQVLPFLTSEQLPIIYENGSILNKIRITLLATLKRCWHLVRAWDADIVYLVREAYPFGPPVFEQLLSLCGRRVIFDFDDAIYTPSTAYHNPLDVLRDWNKTEKLIRMADHVVAGSGYLADYAIKQGKPTAQVSVIPTVVDTTVFRPVAHKSHNADQRVVIGWIGTPRGTSYLIDMLPVFSRLAESFENVRFLFVGAEPFACDGLPIEFKTWSLADEINDILQFDIGIMPLTDDEESRGKCGFKLIQYMSSGLSSVCSPVGANLTIIEDGKCGFFAATHDEWVEKLSRLIESPSLRQAFGKRGRELAEQSFSLASAAPKMHNLFVQLMKETD